MFFVIYLYNLDPSGVVKIAFFIFVFQILTNRQTEINEFAAFWCVINVTAKLEPPVNDFLDANF